jgi:hypothetical protein
LRWLAILRLKRFRLAPGNDGRAIRPTLSVEIVFIRTVGALDGRAILTVAFAVAEPLRRAIGAYDCRSVVAVLLAELVPPKLYSSESRSYDRWSAVPMEDAVAVPEDAAVRLYLDLDTVVFCFVCHA